MLNLTSNFVKLPSYSKTRANHVKVIQQTMNSPFSKWVSLHHLMPLSPTKSRFLIDVLFSYFCRLITDWPVVITMGAFSISLVVDMYCIANHPHFYSSPFKMGLYFYGVIELSSSLYIKLITSICQLVS